jgi:hypothetical protein
VTDKENTLRVFVAGAGGAIGSRLVTQLIVRGGRHLEVEPRACEPHEHPAGHNELLPVE